MHQQISSKSGNSQHFITNKQTNKKDGQHGKSKQTGILLLNSLENKWPMGKSHLRSPNRGGGGGRGRGRARGRGRELEKASKGVRDKGVRKGMSKDKWISSLFLPSFSTLPFSQLRTP